MCKKILVVSSFDLRRNTSSNIRTIALMQALSNRGFEMDVAYIQTNNPIDSVLDDALKKCCNKHFRLIEANATKPLSAGKKTKNNFSFKERVKLIALKIYAKLFVYDVFQTKFKSINNEVFLSIHNDYDFVLSSSEPRSSHKLAKIIFKKCGLSGEWIQYWGDPMSNDVASSKLFPSLEKKEEKKLLKQCDYAIYTNPGCARYMQEKYAFAFDKIFWIPTTDILSEERTDIASVVDVSYVGDYISKYRNITPFYCSCNELALNTIIAGGGDVDLSSTDTVKVLGRVPRNEAIEIENNSKILVVIDNNKPANNVCIQVPGKLYHFALMNKYVLVITDSDILINDYKQYNRFIFCKNNVEDIKSAIKNILFGEIEASFDEALVDFSQNKVADKFIKITNNNKLILKNEKYCEQK